MGVIYAINNLTNGKLYVGSTINEASRKKQHFSDLRRGRHYNPHLQRSFNLHGEQSFNWSVLELVTDDSELLCKEGEWISKLNSTNKNKGYNVSVEPVAPMRGRKHSLETIKLYQESRKGSNHPNAKLTEEKVKHAFRLYDQGLNQKEISSIIGVHYTNISYVLRGKGWKHLGLQVSKVRTNSTSGCVGVYLVKSSGKWKAHIERSGKCYNLGLYDKFEDAVQARKLAERGQFGV